MQEPTLETVASFDDDVPIISETHTLSLPTAMVVLSREIESEEGKYAQLKPYVACLSAHLEKNKLEHAKTSGVLGKLC